MSGIALQGLRCRACRHAAFRSFVALSGVSIPSPRLQPSITYYGSRLYQKDVQVVGSRQFSVLSSASSQADSELPTKSEAKEEESSEASHIPWYLQDESQKPTAHPLKQQELPPLPDNPPPILEKLLHYVSVDAGLDDISLLDLRSIDPPPALGANLIMIIATARSIKHLNVTGDRMCRWLRSKYQLRPTADGLLGRNELKIKLRRRARKAKAASEAGATLNSRDDGITTGWICVSVGDIENGPLKSDDPQKQNFIGFGGPGDKVRIVVQMLVEEKRAELQLESLWGKLLNPEIEEEAKKTRDDIWGESSPGGTSAETSSGMHSGSHVSPFNQRFPQKRHMHTQASPENLEPLSQGLSDDNSQPVGSKQPPTIVSSSAVPPSVSSLLEQLSQLPEEEARGQLGIGPEDRFYTMFLRQFYEAVSKSDTETGLIGKLQLIRAAVRLRQPAYCKRDVYEAFKTLAASGCDISEELAMDTVRTLLSFEKSDPRPEERVPDHDIDLALKVLDIMSLRGVNIFNGEVFFLLHQASSLQSHVRSVKDISDDGNAPKNMDNAAEIPVEEVERVAATHLRLSKIMASENVEFDYKDYPALLEMYFQHGNYTKFWRLWQQISLMQNPRSKELYLLMFRLHAKLGHQRQAVECLSSWVPMMAREQPPVRMDEELTKAIMACMLVADPAIDQKSDDGTVSQFTRLWKHCLGALKDSSPGESAQ
ncbi:ATPase synthesis protein 25 mitochondrial [Arthroderma sp. PD_2]|nr:ATPase synthesis protein 25 mitochondrial [Arthroderma sp. PD_2]